MEKPGQPLDQSTLSLLHASRGGDDRARERLVARYQEPLTRWALVRFPEGGCDPEEVEGLVRRTLRETIDYVVHLPSSEGDSFHWRLRQALQNRLHELTRRRVASEVPSPLASALSEVDLARYERALRRMDRLEKEVVVANLELGLSPEQIARFLSESAPLWKEADEAGEDVPARTAQALLKLAAFIGAESSTL